jgi:hypothetical protein
MTTTPATTPRPGHASVCPGCLHHLPGLESHPEPCGVIHWTEKSRRYSPQITADGCPDYTPRAEDCQG